MKTVITGQDLCLFQEDTDFDVIHIGRILSEPHFIIIQSVAVVYLSASRP